MDRACELIKLKFDQNNCNLATFVSQSDILRDISIEMNKITLSNLNTDCLYKHDMFRILTELLSYIFKTLKRECTEEEYDFIRELCEIICKLSSISLRLANEFKNYDMFKSYFEFFANADLIEFLFKERS